jgi:hypothetical protein
VCILVVERIYTATIPNGGYELRYVEAGSERTEGIWKRRRSYKEHRTRV